MTDHDTPADDALHGTADQVDPGMGGDDRSMAGDGTQHAPGVAFWVTMALGGAVTLFGAVGLFTAEGNDLKSFIPWFAGGALLVDLVVVPLAAAIGLLGRRLIPPPAWPPVRAALLASAVLAVFAAPLVADLGGRPDNESLRPRDYGSGLLTAVVVVWAITLAVGVATMAADRRHRPPAHEAV
ncbi:MAG: hypothetical protein H0U29_09340 [Acidimicrobiia bacterium]|nr:hypothetical protein [Acidimicrobiia bacterium]